MRTLRENAYDSFGFLLLEQGGFGRVVGGFSEVTGLDMELEPAEYRDGSGLEHVRRVPGPPKFGAVTLKRGMIGDPDFLDWIGAVASASARRLQVRMLDQARDTVATFTLSNARPAKCVGLAELNESGKAMAIEELELLHEGIEYA